MKNVNIKASLGVRNDVPPERFKTGDLVDGVNIDIDETGKVSRRRGARRVVPATDGHSLWSSEHRALFVDGDTLFELASDFSTKPLRTGLSRGRRASFVEAAQKIYFSNGAESGVLAGDKSTALGIEVPPSLTVSVTPGDLPAGVYGCTMTYVRTDGQESGARGCVYVDVPANGGLRLSGLSVSSDSDVASKNIYITAPNGEVLYLAAVLENHATDAEYTALAGLSVPCVTQFKAPLPPGDILGYYNGRLYSASGNVLWYSDPYNFELCDLRENFLQFESRVTIFAPVSDGVFVGSESETVFLRGGDPSEFERVPVSPAASVFGTLAYANPRFVTADGVRGATPMWATERGICFGGDGGQFIELTSDRYVLPDVASGSSLYRLQSGTSQFLTAFTQ